MATRKRKSGVDKMLDRCAAERASDEVTHAARGDHHRVICSSAAWRHYFKTLAEAERKRDEIVAENTTPIPSDYYERQARLVSFAVAVERYDGGHWVTVDGSDRTVILGVKYAD